MEGFQKNRIPSAPQKGFRIQVPCIQFHEPFSEIPGQDIRVFSVYGS